MANLTLTERDTAYLIGFYDPDTNLYDVHLCDRLDDHATWEYIEMEFSLPHAKFMMIWRRDGGEFRRREIQSVTKYVRDDMDEFIREGEKVPQFSRIISKPIGKSCLIVSWAPFVKISKVRDVAGGYSTWSEFAELARVEVNKRAEQIASNPNSEHDLKVQLYDGRLPLSPEEQIKEHYVLRSQPYERCNIPSDNTLRIYLDLISKGEFVKAGELLSQDYGIDPPKVYAGPKLPGRNYVSYDFTTKTVMISPRRIPETWKQVSAFLMGYFLYLSHSKEWSFNKDPEQSRILERAEAEGFARRIVQRLIEMGLNPKKF